MTDCIMAGDTVMRFRVRDAYADNYLLADDLSYTFQRLPGEAIGTATLTLQNVVAGSIWRIEDTADNSLVDTGTAAGGDIGVLVPNYGSTRTLRVKVRNASGSPAYKPFETQASVALLAASVYVSQQPDE